jgi:hypothetical protein
MQYLESRTATLGRRGCALLAASSAGLHGVAIPGAGTPAAAVLMSAMVLACLYCARDLWIHGATRTWLLVGVMNLAMIAAHTPRGSGHQHGATARVVADPVDHSSLMSVAMALSAVEAVIATAVLYRRSRRGRSDLLAS